MVKLATTEQQSTNCVVDLGGMHNLQPSDLRAFLRWAIPNTILEKYVDSLEDGGQG